MASSDDEGETFPDSVSDYYFCDGEDEPLSFTQLAIQWNEKERENSNATEGPIFLRGTADNGLQKVYQQVKAWKYDFSNANPEISVLSKDNKWMKLEKPRKSFENVIRSILITVHGLYYCKIKPEASGKSLWDHLSKHFSSYDVRPSENDLIDHMKFIREAVKRDQTLEKSKFLAAFLENPRKRKLPEDADTVTKPSFIVDDSHVEPQDDDFVRKQIEDSESDEEEDHFDSVCAICDNGGNITCCEGKCFRSFHATADIEEAQESQCETLGLRPEELKGQFRCENCLYSRHQCFVCGKLGSSDKSSGAEVFRCSSATCGHFYHPPCVANRLQGDGEAEKQVLEKKIAAGEPFICPVHKCAICKQTENEKVEDLQFAICRRCPKSYHRKCLPRNIKFEDQIDEDDENDVVRAWDNLLQKSRALIYCTAHKIIQDLGTPARTLKFRNINPNKKEEQLSEMLPKMKKKRVAVKKNSVQKSPKVVEKLSAVKLEESSKKRMATSSGPESSKKKKVVDTSNKKTLKRSSSTKVKTPTSNNGQPSLGSRLFDLMQKGIESNNLEKDESSVAVVEEKQTTAAKSVENEGLPPLDAESRKRILALMKDAASSVTLEDVKKYHKGKVPSTHAHSSRVDKSIILARVEGSVEALHVALKKLEEGCSIEDAMAVCEPGVIDQIIRWKEKLRVYLAPFLHGMRYTSFGRHFTKVEKLEKIVDKLQWYVEDGDTVVDFCCGANDFSCLMKKRLDEMGKKKCSYKNFDITPPKNDFNFEKRDWMSVDKKELPIGSQLIMGLNPPFGKNCTLANQFIAKALQFKPKLVVLIVPPETERLDGEKKKNPYDLVWEDAELLAGRSFYLPGSVDVYDKQMDQWNKTPPPLYLWSRPDFTRKHKAIAQEHGHIPQTIPLFNKNTPAPTPPIENNEIKDNLPNDRPVTTKQDPERSTDKVKPASKRSKKDSPAHNDNSNNKKGETEPKKKPQMTREKSFDRNSNKSNNQTEKIDNKPSSGPQKLDDKRSLVAAPSREEQPPQKPQDQKRDDKFLLPPRQDEAPKLDDKQSLLAPSREDQSQKLDDKYSRQDQKLDNKYSSAPSRQDHKLDNKYSSAPSRQDQAPKLDNHTRPSSRQDQKLDNKYSSAPSRQEQAPKRDDNHSRPSSRQDEAQRHDGNYSVHKHDKYSAAPRQDQTPKHNDNHSLAAPCRQDSESDFSFWNDIDPSFDQQLERRYNFNTAEESDFGFRNDPPFDQHFERRYNPPAPAEEPYINTPTYRQQLDGPVLANSTYSMRPEHVPYSSYDRVMNRGSYLDDMSPRGGYPMTHHEPGLTRYAPPDTAPYNRTSTSTTQRYAPRLDELNHTRANAGRPELDNMNHSRMGSMGRPEPPLGNRGMGGYGQPMYPPGFRPDSMGFAPGPYHPYSQHNSSSGWLNE